MLTDDELDFEDFGDLGELEGPELTAEELEKQLELEFAKEAGEVVAEPTKEPAAEPTEKPATETTEKPATVDKEKDIVVEFEEGEMNEAEIKASEAVKKPDEAKRETENKTLVEQDSRYNNQQQQQQQQRFNNNRGNYNNGQGYYNNYGGNNDYYAQQQQQQLKYIPDPMAMNMFPQYPPYSNRIYVNPKFNNGGNNPQQQMLQKRQFIEMEAQRMILLQQQIQLEQEKQRLAELDRKRQEAAENLKKRKEMKDHHVGEKRDRDQTEQEEERQHKRIDARPAIAKGVFSIKGAASRHQQALSPRNVPYTPPHQKPQHNDIRNRLNTPSATERPSITSRLNQPSSFHPNDHTKNTSPASILSNPVVPIVTNGKSNTLIITGLSKDTKEVQIRDMTNTIPGGATDINFDADKMTATVTFGTIENAVTFRRKYNRLPMGDSHISIGFQK